MTDEATPLVPPSRGGLGDRVLRWCTSAALRASLVFSPRPAALIVRRVFASGGARTAELLNRHAPDDVTRLVDERYGDEPDMLLDVFRPSGTSERLPLLLWVHGGGFVGGSKDELAGYFKVIAARGFAVAAPRYSLAPEHRYPTPPRQVMQALEYLQANAEHYSIDVDRIALAGDSAGAHIAAQVGALVTTPGYADAVGVAPTIAPAQLRSLVLACGPYDLALARDAGSPAGHRFIQIVLWAYSGTRHFLDDPAFAAWSITDHVTSAYPATLLTVGNADPLQPHSRLLAEKLLSVGVEAEMLFFPADHEPQLGHEYQFDLDGEAGRLFLERMLDFLRQRLGPSADR